MGLFDWMDDDGQSARDAEEWAGDKIDGLGRWLGVLGPERQDEGPISVPLDAKMNPPSESEDEGFFDGFSDWASDGGQSARDAEEWAGDKIDSFGRWLGVLGPEREDEGPVSVPLDAKMNPPSKTEDEGFLDGFSDWAFDGGQSARDAEEWAGDKIDGLGRWLGILGPEREDEGPVSVPM